MWARQLEGGHIALAFFNRNVHGSGSGGVDSCVWNYTKGEYKEAKGANPNILCGTFAEAEAAKLVCCTNLACKSASSTTSGPQATSGCLKTNADGGYKQDADGYEKTKQGPQPPAPVPSPPGTAPISVKISELGFAVGPAASFAIMDIWGYQKHSDPVTGAGVVTAKDVPIDGTAFLRLTALH